MRKYILILIAVLLTHVAVKSQDSSGYIEPSYFKLTSSNGLIVAVYNAKENRIDDVYPHIFANYDSGQYVSPFAGNIVLKTKERPLRSCYLSNTHIICAEYKDFTVNYFSSFTRHDLIFYIVIRGKKDIISNLDFVAEKGNGNTVSGISLLENALQDLPMRIRGNLISGDFIKPYNDGLCEKYFLFSFTDSLHKDGKLVQKTITELSGEKSSLLDRELKYMRNTISSCFIPENITPKERNVLEQSISILKMSQVSDYEIFPNSHGQILASIRPGLWHTAWVRDGSFAIQAMTRLGMYSEARKGLEFMLKAPSGNFKHYIYTDGKDYGPGVDYQISLTRYFGNGKEECDYNEAGPNIEYDDFGLFLIAFSDYVNRSGDSSFLKKWEHLVSSKVADATICCIDTNSLIKADSGPWEHHLAMTRQYTFTSGVCARGLEQYGVLLRKYNRPYQTYLSAAGKLKQGIIANMLCDKRYFKGNSNDLLKTDHEYYDAGAFEIFANGLISDRQLFFSHMEEYNKYLRIKGPRPGYIRLNSKDPYENQEWVFINLRLAMASLLFNEKEEAAELLNFVTSQASVNYNTIPEMYSNRLQMDKVNADDRVNNIWCNCIRDMDNQYIGTIPMVGYGSGAYVLSLFEYYQK
jgi:GH15 family glucan-1,4-alpha-glucosidase